MELGVSGSRSELVDSLKAYSSHRGNPPLLLFPEEAATNGRAGLLHFRYRSSCCCDTEALGFGFGIIPCGIPPFQLLAVLSVGRGAACRPASAEAFGHCGEWGHRAGGLCKSGLCDGAVNPALKPGGDAAWPRALLPRD